MFKRSYNSDHVKQDNGSIKATFKQGWMNYFDANEQWQSIDTQFKDAGDYFEVSDAPFIMRAPKLSTGSAEFISNNRYDIFNKAMIKDAPFKMTIRPIGAAQVDGVIESGNLGWGETNYVIYKNAYPQLDADLIYYVQHGRAPKLRKLVRFNSKPNAEVKLKFDLSFDKKPYVKCDGNLWNEKNILKAQGCLAFRPTQENSPRGVGLYDFFLWDKWSKRKKIDAELIKLGQNQTQLTKTISVAEFDGLSFPCYTDASASFNPDANPESTSVDGYMSNSVASETWAQITAGDATAVNDSDSIIQVRVIASSITDEYSHLERVKCLFDTSSIGAGYYVSSASFGFTPFFSTQDDFGMGLALVSASTASNTSLSTSDFNITSFGSTRLATDIALAATVEEDQSTMTLNAAGIANIDLEGVSKFGLICDFDLDGAPTWINSGDSRAGIYSAENGANEPVLDVTYFEISGYTNLPLMGVG